MSASPPAGAKGLDPDAPLKIAYLPYRGKPHVGGQGVYTRHLTKALADLGHTVEVYSGQPYPVLDERVALHQLPSLDLWRDPADALASTANYLKGYGWKAGAPWGEGTANFQVLHQWNKADVYCRTIVWFAEQIQ